MKSLHRLFKYCRWLCTFSCVCLGLDNCRNLQFNHPILHISLTEVVSHVIPTRLRQLVKPNLLLPKSLHALLYCFGDCVYYPAGFIIFAQHVQLWIFFFIYLVFPILLVVRTSKIAQTVSDCIQHLLKYYLMLSYCLSHLFSISHIFLLMLNPCLFVLYSHSCHSSLSIPINLIQSVRHRLILSVWFT